MRLAGLHPARCRTELTPNRRSRSLPRCCGARLDHAGPCQHASPGLLALQDKILRLLAPAGPAGTVSAGMPASPGSYFADLPALRLLACSTWPAARHLIPSEEAASAVGHHIHSPPREHARPRAAAAT